MSKTIFPGGVVSRQKQAAWRPSGGGTVTNMKANGSFAEVYPPNSEQNSGSGFDWSVFDSGGMEIDSGMEGSMAAAKKAAGAILRSASNAKVGSSRKQAGGYDYLDPYIQQRFDEMAPDGDGRAYWESLSYSEQVNAEDQFEYDQELYSSKRKQATYAEADEMVAIWDYVEWCKDKGLNPKDRDNLEAFVDAGMMSYLNEEDSYDDIERYIDGELEIDMEQYPFLARTLRKATRKQANEEIPYVLAEGNYGSGAVDIFPNASGVYAWEWGGSGDDDEDYEGSGESPTFEQAVKDMFYDSAGILEDMDPNRIIRQGIEMMGRYSSKKALRKATKKENDMPNRRRRQAEFGRNDQGEWEDTQISQTPPAEPAVDPSEGGDAPNSTNEQRVQREDPDNNQLAAIRKMERELRAMKRQLTARPIGEMNSDEGGGDVRREDLYEDYEDPSPKDAAYKARRNKDFVAWVSKEHGKKLTEAKSLGELRSWARSYSRLARIDVSELHEVVSKVAADKRKAANARQAELEKGEQKPAPRQARRKHQPRRRRVAKRPVQAVDAKDYGISSLSEEELFEEWLMAEYNRRPEDVGPEDRDQFYNEFLDGGGVVDWEKLYAKRAAQAAKRKRAETAPADDLDVAAPDDRINVEKPTQNTTDDEAQKSQFDKGDFGNNAGDDIAKPDRSLDHQWLPGEGRKSSRQTPKGHETVRLAEAYVAAGLADPSERWKLATDFEGMDRSVILDRTALLERVATVTAATQKKTAGNFGASMRSAVPMNLAGGGGAAVTAAADAGDSDTDFFLMK